MHINLSSDDPARRSLCIKKNSWPQQSLTESQNTLVANQQ